MAKVYSSLLRWSHRSLQIKKSLLADSQNSFLWSVQISNQFDDYSKRDRDGDNRERSASSTEAGMVTHGDKRKRRDCEKAQPDCAGMRLLSDACIRVAWRSII